MTRTAMLEVVSVRGPVFVQDAGRPGWMHHGVPPGGAWVPELLARANAAASNAAGAAALESFAEFTLRAVGGDATLAVDDRVVSLRDGEELRVPAPDRHRMRYVAVRGGVDVPPLLGGRGTLLVASMGGLAGRTLRRGDAIRPGDCQAESFVAPPPPDLDAPLGVIPGPDLERFAPGALDALLASEFRVSLRTDRVGMRLEGAVIARADGDAGVSTPMVRGAIEVPASGEPIVLGPDHPTTGGYPVIAVVARRELGALFARRAGAGVRFIRAEKP